MKFREYSQLYVATDGRYSKIGVSDNVLARQPKAIRFLDGEARTAVLRIVAYWTRPDSAHIERFFVTAIGYLRVAGQEWFDVPADDLVDAVGQQIWYLDIGRNDPKNRRPLPFNLEDRKAEKTEGLVRFQERYCRILEPC